MDENFTENVRHLIDSIPGLFCQINSSGKLILWNRYFEKVTGYSNSELINIHALDIFKGKDRRTAEQNLTKAFLEGEGELEAELCAKDGTKTPYHLNAQRETIAGEVVVTGIGHSIEKQKSLEMELCINEEKFRNVFDNSAMGTSINYLDGSVHVNLAFCRMLGYTIEELSRIGPQSITHPDDFELSNQIKKELLSEGKASSRVTKRYLNKDGSIIWADVHTVLQKDSEGRPLFYISTLMDITDRKKAEAELKVHHDHLNELVIMRTMELKSAMENLERSNKELEQFAYVASHDLQEPLRAVVSYLQFLENLYGENLDDKGRSFIAKAVNAAARMQAMITSLLMYSRITTHGKPFIPCDCAAIVKNAILDLQTVIDKRGAVVTCDSLPKIVADESHIERLFQNLIGNGIKFCDIETPMVHISAKTENGAWIFSVKDNGIGIEEQYFGRIFKIFQRLHGRDKYEGTGIGLADCKKIVERHGGRIWVESTPGQGSTFFFTLGTMHQSGNL